MGASHCVFEQSVANYKMNLMETIPDAEMQIHMIIHGRFRIKEIAAAKEEAIIRVGNFSAIIGIIEEGLISMLVKKWKTIMGIIAMGRGVILITDGVRPLSQVNFAGGDNNYS